MAHCLLIMLWTDEFALGCPYQVSTLNMPRAPALFTCWATLTPVAPDEIAAVLALPALIVPAVLLALKVAKLLTLPCFHAFMRPSACSVLVHARISVCICMYMCMYPKVELGLTEHA